MMEIISWGLLGIFISSFLLYLIPFIGPSTMIYSGVLAAIHHYDPPALIGVAVAAGASVAKTIHYYVSYFAGRALSEESINRLQGYCERLGRWKSVATFVSSATPIPDEPVLVSLALVNYSPVRFLLVYFLGKLVITIPGAYLGRSARHILHGLIGEVPMAIVSIVFTVIVTVVLLKVDLSKLWRRRTQGHEQARSFAKEH